MPQEPKIKPAISIIMPLYNKEHEVRRSINSILAQTDTGFELIVVNDGSTDKGARIVQTVQDNRIKMIHQENAGVSAARNRGIEASRTDLIAFLDADDEWKPTFLEIILRLRKKFPDCSVFSTGFSYLNQDGTERSPIINGVPPHPWHGVLENYFHVAAKSDPPLCSSAIAVTKEAITTINGFPLGIKSGEDLLTWARLAAKYAIAYDTRHLALFRQRSSAHEEPTRTPDTPDNVARELVNLLKEVKTTHQTGLRHYIAWWHKSRASMYLRLQQRSKAFKEVMKMGLYHLNRKFCIYLICLILPFSLLQQLIRKHNKNNS